MLLFDIGDSVQRGFDEFAVWVPRLIGFLAVLVIGYFVAKMVGSLIGRLLRRAGLDRTLQSSQVGQWVGKVTASPSRLLGSLVFWVIFIGAISIAVDVLGITALQDLVAAVWGYVPNVVAALLIFLVAGAVSAAVAAIVARTMGDTTTGRVVGTVAPILIMAIAVFMILDQLAIAENIVTITYAALMGAVALGMAIAFGLGGREVAAQMLQGAYASRETMKQDMQTGKERAGEQMNKMREKIEGDDAGGPTYEPASGDLAARYRDQQGSGSTAL